MAKRGRKPKANKEIVKVTNAELSDGVAKFTVRHPATKELEEDLKSAGVAVERLSTTPEPQFEETVKIVTVKDEIQPENINRQNNDVNILTLNELYRTIVNNRQISTRSKEKYDSEWKELHPGFRFPQGMTLDQRIRYMENVSHFKLQEE